ncbi:MAG TPA: hypothetical protein VFK82_11240 [Burkholderiaceae bacterium]|nr:hypothetical protein [Burkholderiaceae bacterium]
MRGPVRCALAAAALLAAAGCASTPASPARLIGPLEGACLAEVTGFAEDTLKRKVTLAGSDFSTASEVVLTKVAPRDAQGRLLDGAIRGAPVAETLRLSRTGNQCSITHVESGAARELRACRCMNTP